MDTQQTPRRHDYGVTVISWVNDPIMYQRMVMPTVTGGHQVGNFDLQVIAVSESAGARNIGQAYNMALARAKHTIKVYVHQDVYIHDRTFMEKLRAMLLMNNHLAPHIGAVGIIGSTVDTGAAFFHAPTECHMGRKNALWWPHRRRVAVVDGFLLATNQSLPFSEEYETVHMAVEDYCMRVREAGKEVWTIPSLVEHKSPGKLDDAYWRSAYKFRRKWAHMLPPDLPSLKTYIEEGVPGTRLQTDFEWLVLGSSE